LNLACAHCALDRPAFLHRAHGRRCEPSRGNPAPVPALIVGVRWQRPHDQERRRRRLIGGA
jgi:hypothetical protein